MNGTATDIYFVRHGFTEGNRQGLFEGQGNSSLCGIGRLQAKACAEELKEVPFTGAYASDLNRAVQTAEILLEYHPAVKLIRTPALREWDLGELDGMLQTEVVAHHGEILRKFQHEVGDFDVPGGEIKSDFQKRVSGLIEEAVAANEGGCVLLVAHGWTAGRILAHMYGPPKHGFALPVPVNTGISIFRYFHDEKVYKLLTWNSFSHLKGLPVNYNPVD